MILGINGILAGKGSSCGYADTDVCAFITAANITDNTQKNAINQLVLDLKSANIWTKMKAIYPFVGGTASQHRFNLKDPRTVSGAFYLDFYGGGTHSANGYQPDGATAYADTKLNPNTVLTSLSHLSYYSRTDSTRSEVNGGQDDQTSTSAQMYILGNKTTDVFSLSSNDAQRVTSSSTSTLGLYLVSRTSSTSLKGYKNAANVGVNISASTGTKPNINMYIGAFNYKNSGGAFTIYYGNKECAFSSIGDGLSDSEATAFYNAVQTFNTTLGRQVGVPIVADSDAQAFLNAAVITDTTQASAINTLVTDLKSANIWTKMKALYPFVGGTASQHRFNLKDPRPVADAFYLDFYGGGTHSATGYQTNGNSYANTKLIPLYVQSLNSNGLGYYAGTLNTANLGDPIDMGANNSGTQQSWVFTRNTDVTAAVNGSAISGSIVNRLGLFSAHKTSSTTTSVYRNSNLINTGNSGGSLPIAEIYLGTISVNAIPYSSGYVNTEFRLSYISDGLDSTDMTNFYNAVQAYQTTLGRQV